MSTEEWTLEKAKAMAHRFPTPLHKSFQHACAHAEELQQENAKLRARLERLTKAVESMFEYSCVDKIGDYCAPARMWEQLGQALKDNEETDIDSISGQGSTVRPEDFQITDELIEKIKESESE